MELPWSRFGENFTTEGLEEEDTHIGDRFQVGQVAEMVIKQLRQAGDEIRARRPRQSMSFEAAARDLFFGCEGRHGRRRIDESTGMKTVSPWRTSIVPTRTAARQFY
jgi:hypothetical protein